jgi:hypothetical protein
MAQSIHIDLVPSYISLACRAQGPLNTRWIRNGPRQTPQRRRRRLRLRVRVVLQPGTSLVGGIWLGTVTFGIVLQVFLSGCQLTPGDKYIVRLGLG